MAPTKKPRNFTKYPKLPPELKTRIIFFAVMPRIFEVKIDTEARLGTTIKIKAGPVPPLLQVDSFTRQEMQRTYKLIKPGQPWSNSYHYINFNLDTIYIAKYKVLPPLLVLKYYFIQHFQTQVDELLFRHPRLESLSLVYDNRRGHRKMSPEKYEFIPAAGIVNRGSKFCPSYTHRWNQVSNKECMKHEFITSITNFENTRTQEKQSPELKGFWEANMDWKRPEWETVSIVKTRK